MKVRVAGTVTSPNDVYNMHETRSSYRLISKRTFASETDAIDLKRTQAGERPTSCQQQKCKIEGEHLLALPLGVIED